MKNTFGILLISMILSVSVSAQDYLSPTPPLLKGYKDNPGKVLKNHYFNYIRVKDKSGENERQSTGHYWEVNYVYDSTFRQKLKFRDFMTQQVEDLGGILFYSDTASVHFAIPRDSAGNLWGKVNFSSDKTYRLKLIEERVFVNKLKFDTPPEPLYAEYVDTVKLPPRINFLPNTRIARVRYSKFNHFDISYVSKDKTSYQQTLMGPFWDFKLNVVDDNGKVDKRISTVEIMESYYRAVLKSNGKIVKNRLREMIFYLPVDNDKKLWVRLMTSLDGVYFLRMILEADSDATPPRSLADRQKIFKKGK